MNYFVGSLLLFPYLKATSKQCQFIRRYYEHQQLLNEGKLIEEYEDPDTSSPFYEICHASQVNSIYYQTVIRAVENNPHIPSLIELLDYHGIFQTAFATIMKNIIKIAHPFYRNGVVYISEQVKMSDGGTIGLEWGVQIEEYRKNPHMTINDLKKEKIVILLHGILGDSQSEYIYYFIPQLIQAGYTPVVYVARGCGNLSITSDSFFSGKLASDLYEITRYIKLNYQLESSPSSSSSSSSSSSAHPDPKKKLFAIGYSLGAASLLNYLTHFKELTYLTAAVSICPPWNVVKNSLYPTTLSKCGSSLIGIPLKQYFIKHYSSLIHYNPSLKTILSYWQVIRSITIKDFDDALYRCFYESNLAMNYSVEKSRGMNLFTITRNQFMPIPSTKQHQTVLDYYNDINPSEHIANIMIPTLTIAALDDPICPHDNIPSGNSCEMFGPNVIVIKANFGGHLGFLEHDSWTIAWSDKIAIEWFNAF